MTTHPLPDTPSHTVLMDIAYGDFQVSMWAAAAEARTIGASAYEPALDPGGTRVAFVCTGDPLQNLTTGRRLFVLERGRDRRSCRCERGSGVGLEHTPHDLHGSAIPGRSHKVPARGSAPRPTCMSATRTL